MNKNILLEIINEITAEADEVLETKNKTDYENGQLLAFSTALSIIKDSLSGYDLKEYGIDYDIDNRYLIREHISKEELSIQDIHTGELSIVEMALEHAGALYRVNGIISAVNHKLLSPKIIEMIKYLKNDKTVISGYKVSDFSEAALDILDIEKYTEDSESVLRLIQSKFNF